MNTKDFLRLGWRLGRRTHLATDFIFKFILSDGDKSRLHKEVAAIVARGTCAACGFVHPRVCELLVRGCGRAFELLRASAYVSREARSQ